MTALSGSLTNVIGHVERAGGTAAVALAMGLLLAGCSVKLHGVQSSGGGAATTTTAAQVGASASYSRGGVAASSGRVPPASSPGGHLSLGKGASAALILGLIIADAVHFLSARWGADGARPVERPMNETCSCYRENGGQPAAVGGRP